MKAKEINISDEKPDKDGVINLYLEKNGGTVKLKAQTITGNIGSPWFIANTELTKKGKLRIRLCGAVDDKLIKTNKSGEIKIV